MEDCEPVTTTQPSLDAYFRFAVPRAIVKLVQACAEPDGTFDAGPESRLYLATGLLVSPDVSRPPNCPPELHLIGETGMDGIVCGCVIHDPKLAGEVPLALFDPTLGRADYLGLDTRRSIGVLIGMQLTQLAGDPRTIAREIAEEMGFDPNELPSEPPLEVRPRIPPGWRFAATADGLGVVAEGRFFAPDQEYDEEPDAFDAADPCDVLETAEHALRDAAPATALWHLRNALALADAPVAVASLTAALGQAYHALGRAEIAGHER